jgi:CubicO group peptidase (beta-lactamase class C family)
VSDGRAAIAAATIAAVVAAAASADSHVMTCIGIPSAAPDPFRAGTEVAYPRFMRLAAAQALLDQAQAAGAFPAGAIEVGRSAGPLWRYTCGRLTYDEHAPACEFDTVFDLASLTKVIATTSLVMRHVRSGTMGLETPVSLALPAWRHRERDGIRVRHLLDHSSGLPAHANFWERMAGRDAIADAIGRLPLDHPPGTASVYSDLGFMLLGFLLEAVAQRPLDAQFASLARGWDSDLRFLPPPAWASRTAPTEVDPWRGRLLSGEVHDQNAAALGGVAAHAGLFGTVGDVGSFARLVLTTRLRPTRLGTPDLLAAFAQRSRVPGSSRALGWDTMRPTSSCGTKLSPAAIGHTGFTGTSLWIDLDRDFYVALLTNRVYPTRENTSWRQWRPRVHDAVVDDLTRAIGLPPPCAA